MKTKNILVNVGIFVAVALFMALAIIFKWELGAWGYVISGIGFAVIVWYGFFRKSK